AMAVGGKALAHLLCVGHRHLAAEELGGERGHPRNPISRRASAAATIAAVSVRSTTGPKVATATPRERASSSSAAEKPGSGPISSVGERRPTIRSARPPEAPVLLSTTACRLSTSG